MEKRLVTRYATKSPEAADENQRRIEGVFEDLAANRPGTVSYIVLRLADDSFVQRRGQVPVDVRVSRGRLHLPGCVDADRAGGVTSYAIAVGSILDHLGDARTLPDLSRHPVNQAVGRLIGHRQVDPVGHIQLAIC
jgi:hypothetical protein